MRRLPMQAATSTACERKWAKRCPAQLARGRRRAADLFSFPKAQWKTLSTTNVIERLNEEFRWRVKTQGPRPTEDAALIPSSAWSPAGRSSCGRSPLDFPHQAAPLEDQPK